MDLILAMEKEYGSYICRVDKVLSSGFAEAMVVAVVEYPSQRAILWREKIAPRKPYEFGHLRRFCDYEVYAAPVPDYPKSLMEALDKAIDSARSRGDIAELEVLEIRREELNPRVINQRRRGQ